MTRLPEDPDAAGRRKHWVSNAPLWGRAARRLLQPATGAGPGDAFVSLQLAAVAFHRFLEYSVYLLDGHGSVYQDDNARRDCPVDPRDVRKVRDRLARIRNTVLHIGGDDPVGTSVDADWVRDPDPTVVLRTTDTGGRSVKVDAITRAEIEAVLDQLEPWMLGQFNRLVLP